MCFVGTMWEIPKDAVYSVDLYYFDKKNMRFLYEMQRDSIFIIIGKKDYWFEILYQGELKYIDSEYFKINTQVKIIT